MALTVKQAADVKELVAAMDRLLAGHATQRITNGVATDVTGTTALSAADQDQADVRATVRNSLKALRLNLNSNTTAEV